LRLRILRQLELPSPPGLAGWDREEADAIRESAEVNYLPSDGIWRKDIISPRRYLAIRIRPPQGELSRDGHACATSASSQPLRSRKRLWPRSDPMAPGKGPAPSSMLMTC
jgi:hypothetical protein